MQTYDVVIIGGHNGLTCAAYLGMVGLNRDPIVIRDLVTGLDILDACSER